MIENRTFDEIVVGETASVTRTLGEQDIQLFALVSGDVNPAHLDAEYAAGDMFGRVIAHGLWGGGLISAVLGTRICGACSMLRQRQRIVATRHHSHERYGAACFVQQ